MRGLFRSATRADVEPGRAASELRALDRMTWRLPKAGAATLVATALFDERQADTLAAEALGGRVGVHEAVIHPALVTPPVTLSGLPLHGFNSSMAPTAFHAEKCSSSA